MVRSIIAVCLVTLCSCTTMQEGPPMAPAPDSGTRFGVGIIAGGSEASDDLGVEAGGTLFGFRFDVTGRPGDGPVDIGVRTGFQFGDLDIDYLPIGVNGTIEAGQFVFAPMIRLNLINTPGAKVQPFLEGAVGFQRTSIETTLSGQGASISGTEDDDGLWFALGGGLAFRVATKTELVVGFEYQHSELSDLDAETEGYLAHVGGRFGF